MNKKVKNIIISVLLGIFVILFPVMSGVIAGIAKISAPGVYFLQAGFMLIPIIVFVIYYLIKHKKASDYCLGSFEYKNLLYYLIVLPVYIPLAVKGFVAKDFLSLLGIFLLYLFVGITEELYYRSIIMHKLKDDFSPILVIIISTLIFGFGHMAVAFSGTNALDIALTIINALFFGLMASSLIYLTKIVYPLMFIHFLFDFESKFIDIEPNTLMVLEIIRGTILALVAIGLFVLVVLKERRNKIEYLENKE